MNRAGFTLTELLIVLVIIGILTGIAYPIYNYHVIKVRRTHAAVLLTDLATQIEQYYNDNHSYQGANPNIENDIFYHFAITTTATSYELKAIPIGPQAKSDTKCATLILDQLGHKSITGTGDITNCWPQ